MLDLDFKRNFAIWFRANSESNEKKNLKNYIIEKICKYANENNRPAEQIRGMAILLNDLLRLEDEYLK